MKLVSSGLEAWLVQRIGAIYMLLFVPYMVWSLTARPVESYSQWHAWISDPGMTVALSLFFLALLSHMWVGLRDVLLDYAKPSFVTRAAVTSLGLSILLLGGWVLKILFNAWL